MRFYLPLAGAVVIVSMLVSEVFAQAIETITPESPDPDFLVQGEYASENKAMQVIARGDGEFEMVVYSLGLPGAGWDKSPARRVDGDAETVEQLVQSMGLKRVERQSPTLNARPPADAVILFDGSEESLKENWRSGAKRSEEGLLLPGAFTKQTFSDYRLHVEFITPFMPSALGQARGNSGVYHQGRYETQILDSFGLEGKNNETGGIYEVRDPDLNACFTPLSWQTYDVEFAAAKFDDAGKKISPARITVNLNGVPVQVGIELPGATRAAPMKESSEPGPLYLQDHGNPVRFRNIWIVPRDVAKESRRPIVSGYERWFVDNDSKGMGGKLLIESLGCQSCHAGDSVGKSVQVGPNLDFVGSRVRADHLTQFITAPRDTKPGTTMPDPWQGMSDEERQQSATAIVNFLLAGTAGIKDQVGDAAAVERGKTLYHNQGCVACHAPIEVAAATAMPRVSVPLGNLTAKYTLGSLSGFLLNPLAVRPCGRMPTTVATTGEAKDIATYLLRDVVVVPGGEIIQRRIYRGKWDRLPNLESLKPDSQSQVDQLKIDDVPGNFAASFDSFLQIYETGKYTFRLASDDGSKLLIDGKVVIDHDGIHPETEKKKQIKLAAGVYPIQILYFEGGGQRGLKLDVESEQAGREAITTKLCATIKGKPRELLPTYFKPDASLVTQGARLFVSAGCANCHAKSGLELTSNDPLAAKPLSDCSPDAGCLASSVPTGLPNYELTSIQRQHIAAAMASLGDQVMTDVDSIHYTMASFNCYACHVRDGVGGPDATRSVYFTTPTPEMGDEGRLPPTLTGAGDKLNEAYLREILANGVDERPYMRTRMPGFGNAIPDAFVSTLIKLDLHDQGHDGTTIVANADDLLADGRTLCGNAGLACIKCHTFNGLGLPGIQAIDMLRMPPRLRRDWFERYLIDPQTYRPGTRMPASFLDGKSVLAGIADGRPANQIEAMWRYLSLGENAKVPSGLLADAIELKDPRRAIIYRNFFNGSSPRGIAVGYPEAVNVIWDAEKMTLVAAWKNGFIDAAKHWTGRGAGNQDPLGDAVISFDRQTPIAVLADASAPWPSDVMKGGNYRFLGYSLDQKGKPTFRYRVSDLIVEDKIEAVASESSARMINRIMQITGEGSVTMLVAKGKIQPSNDGWYRVDNRYQVRLNSGNGQLLSFGDVQELRVEATPGVNPNSTVTVTVKINW